MRWPWNPEGRQHQLWVPQAPPEEAPLAVGRAHMSSPSLGLAQAGPTRSQKNTLDRLEPPAIGSGPGMKTFEGELNCFFFLLSSARNKMHEPGANQTCRRFQKHLRDMPASVFWKSFSGFPLICAHFFLCAGEKHLFSQVP